MNSLGSALTIKSTDGDLFRDCIECECFQLAERIIDAVEPKSPVLNKWITIAFERGSSIIVELLLSKGATFSPSTTSGLRGFIIPATYRRDGRVSIVSDSVYEFYGLRAICISRLPFHMWSIMEVERQAEDDDYYFEAVIEEISDDTIFCIGVVASDHSPFEMVTASRNGCGFRM